ncbi:MAG: OmpA family protein [Sulfuricaulis sp.]
MKQIWRLVLMVGVFLTGCVSTSTFDQKQTELAACQKQAQSEKSDLDACQSARGEAENKLTVANQELGVYRQAAEARKSKVDELQKQEDDLRARLSQELTDKNVEIEQLRGQLSVRMLDKIVFRSGSADILPSGMVVLDKLADALKGNDDTIRVEGHTDDTPISAKLKSKYPSNWELSAARAAGVARYFETVRQIDPKRLEAVGFSMYRPVAPNDSPENKQRNRRVEIVLKPAAEPEAAAPTPAPAAVPADPAAKP